MISLIKKMVQKKSQEMNLLDSKNKVISYAIYKANCNANGTPIQRNI